jgi:hypothetical protein
MAVVPIVPNKIPIRGFEPEECTNDLATGAGTSVIPGHLVELYKDSTNVLAWRSNSSATNLPSMSVALEHGAQRIDNTTLSTPYVAGDNVSVWWLEPGKMFWGWIPSGQTINIGDPLQSNGDGGLKGATSQAASAGLARFVAGETLGVVTVAKHCKVWVVA